MPVMYSLTPPDRNKRLYKLGTSRARDASYKIHKILKIDRRNRRPVKNMQLRVGPALNAIYNKRPAFNSFGRDKTNLRVDTTWANTARRRSNYEFYETQPKGFGRNYYGLRIDPNPDPWEQYKKDHNPPEHLRLPRLPTPYSTQSARKHVYNYDARPKKHAGYNYSASWASEIAVPEPFELYRYLSDEMWEIIVRNPNGTSNFDEYEEREMRKVYGEGLLSTCGLHWDDIWTAREEQSPGSEQDADHESIDEENDRAPQQPARDLAQAGIHGHPLR